MSTSAFSTRGKNVRRNRISVQTSANRSLGSQRQLAAFVDLPGSPFAPSAKPYEPNPVKDLIPDELFQLLRTHDLISEMGIRNYTIRQQYHAFRTERSMSTAQAMKEIQDLYPYLQLDTIRKIVYRIGPPSNRKAAM
jgi:hypothetical protein